MYIDCTLCIHIQVLLVGDPCQLGPVLSSHLAGSSGLGVSFLERVMEMRNYCRQEEKFKGHGSYDPLLVFTCIHYCVPKSATGKCV